MSDFDDFLARLASVKYRPSGPQLDPLITKEDLVKIYDYFLAGKDRNVLAQIAALQPTQAYRIAKNPPLIPRTLNILRSPEGEFKLMVETKSKLADGTKKNLEKGQGAVKTGKPVWRVDSGEIEHYNLVAKVGTTTQGLDFAKLEELREEVGISQMINAPEVNYTEIGAAYIGKSGDHKVSVYSLKANENLFQFIYSSRFQYLSQQQKNKWIEDLLKGLSRFHSQDLVHQDLKPPNILVYGNKTEGFSLKITDLGLTKREGDLYSTALSTEGYQSPEIATYYADPRTGPKTHLYSYFNTPHSQHTFGVQVARTLPPKSDPELFSLAYANRANDMWALGIIIYELRFGRRPNLFNPIDRFNIDSDPLLQGLLAFTRDKRLKIEQALKCYTAQEYANLLPIILAYTKGPAEFLMLLNNYPFELGIPKDPFVKFIHQLVDPNFVKMVAADIQHSSDWWQKYQLTNQFGFQDKLVEYTLGYAVHYGLVAEMQSLLLNPVISQAVASNNNAFLEAAIKNGHFAVVRELIAHPAVRDQAAMTGHKLLASMLPMISLPIFKEMLTIGRLQAQVAYYDNYLLRLAIECGRTDIAKELMTIKEVKENVLSIFPAALYFKRTEIIQDIFKLQNPYQEELIKLSNMPLAPGEAMRRKRTQDNLEQKKGLFNALILKVDEVLATLKGDPVANRLLSLALTKAIVDKQWSLGKNNTFLAPTALDTIVTQLKQTHPYLKLDQLNVYLFCEKYNDKGQGAQKLSFSGPKIKP